MSRYHELSRETAGADPGGSGPPLGKSIQVQ